MESVSKEILSTLVYLLPGFLTAWVFYGLTSFARPSQFDQIVQALIFTLITQALLVVEKAFLIMLGQYWTIGAWNEQSALLCSALTALLLGILFSYLANNDRVHKLARYFGITRETSYSSQWFRTFFNRITYVVLHLKDERRLYGWPIEWPSDPSRGHFVLEDASWLLADGAVKETKLSAVDAMLVNVKDVKWVEFMKIKLEDANEQSQAPNAAPVTADAASGAERR